MLKKRKFWLRLSLFLVLVPVLLFTITLVIIYSNQDKIVQHFIQTANEDFKGEIVLEDSHIAPFANFPYISIDLEGFSVFENKDLSKEPVIELEDLYIGFNLWSLLSGSFDIKSVKLEKGDINIVEYAPGDFNIMRAFETNEEKEIEDVEEEFHLDLKELLLDHVDINKMDADSMEYDAFFNSADIAFKSKEEHLYFSMKSDIRLSIIEKGDTSFIKNKHIETDAVFDYLKDKDLIKIPKSFVKIAEVKFDFEGDIDVLDDFNLDLNFQGKKPDFSLLIALVPDDLIPVLKTFENKGDVFFTAALDGSSVNGKTPAIEARFGCVDGFFRNPDTDKVLEDLNFTGYFTNGADRSLESMRFELTDFTAKPEAGDFRVDLTAENFNAPDIDLKLLTNFELDYLAKFLSVDQLTDLSGSVSLETNFHDIIDLDNPEKAIEKLNESYFTQLDVKNLAFNVPGYNERIENINVDLHVDGEYAKLRRFDFRIGGSDLSIVGVVNDLPSILHHTNDEIIAKLSLHSDAVDINELTLAKGNNSFDEYIKNFNMDLNFTSTAKKLTESPFLPYGEFKVNKFNAELSNYPHAFHDFTVDVMIDTNALEIIDISGMIDKSDFHLLGTLENYPFWFQDTIIGDALVDFDLTADRIQFEDLFSYEGDNYFPEDYRHEELTDFKLHGKSELHFKKEGFYAADVRLTELTGKMKVHPLALNKFDGRVHLEGDHISLEKFGGNIGRTSFDMDLEYFFGEDSSLLLKENSISFRSKHLDFDQLLDYETPEPNETVEHDSVFSIFDIPFPDMAYQFRIGKMNYHKYLINNIKADLRTTTNHMLYVDTLQMNIAGGHMDIGGYFNGADRNHIYFNPTISMDKINLDKLMFKFDNFGQDEVVSDNLHGDITGKLWGKIHMHADLTPMINESDIHMDIEVTGGSIENYGPLEALSGYFEDDQLHKVIFDTLANHVDLVNGEMIIPEMIINTNLGFIAVSGKQDMEYNMEYYLRVPLKMITGAGSRKLFGKKEEKDPAEISDYDPNKKYRFVNIKIVGDAEDFKVTLGKNKGK